MCVSSPLIILVSCPLVNVSQTQIASLSLLDQLTHDCCGRRNTTVVEEDKHSTLEKCFVLWPMVESLILVNGFHEDVLDRKDDVLS